MSMLTGRFWYVWVEIGSFAEWKVYWLFWCDKRGTLIWTGLKLSSCWEGNGVDPVGYEEKPGVEGKFVVKVMIAQDTLNLRWFNQ